MLPLSFFLACIFLFFLIFVCIFLSGIDGLVGMKLICGTTVARKKDRVGKEGKVSIRER